MGVGVGVGVAVGSGGAVVGEGFAGATVAGGLVGAGGKVGSTFLLRLHAATNNIRANRLTTKRIRNCVLFKADLRCVFHNFVLHASPTRKSAFNCNARHALFAIRKSVGRGLILFLGALGLIDNALGQMLRHALVTQKFDAIYASALRHGA